MNFEPAANADPQDVSIIPNAEAYFEGLHLALDTVAREQRYLAFLRAPPAEEAWAFYRHIVANDFCQFVAVASGQVLGWCDVLPTAAGTRAHIGTLGIGLIPQARHQGIGARLMTAALAKAKAQEGLARIELSVRTDNLNAIALYLRFGFVVEGISRRSFRVGDQDHDTYLMALLC